MAQHDDASDERSENLAAWQNGPKEDFTIAAAELYSPGSDEVLIKVSGSVTNVEGNSV
jgi:hypothetical protein